MLMPLAHVIEILIGDKHDMANADVVSGCSDRVQCAYRKNNLHAFCNIGGIGDDLGDVMPIVNRAYTQAIRFGVCLDRDDLCNHETALQECTRVYRTDQTAVQTATT